MMSKFHIERGCVFYSPVEPPPLSRGEVPVEWAANRAKRDGEGRYHITVVPPTEEEAVALVELLAEADQLPVCNTAPEKPYYVLATVVQSEVCYAPVLFPLAQQLRLQVGLAERAGLHLTLGYATADNHTLDKSFRSLIKTSEEKWNKEEINRFLSDCVKVHTHTTRKYKPNEEEEKEKEEEVLPFENLDSVTRDFILFLFQEVQYADSADLYKLYLILFCKSREEKLQVLHQMVRAGHVAAGLTALVRLKEEEGTVLSLMEEVVIGNSHNKSKGDDDEHEEVTAAGAGNGRRITRCDETQVKLLAEFYNHHRDPSTSKFYAVAQQSSASRGGAAPKGKENPKSSEESMEVLFLRCPANFTPVCTSTFSDDHDNNTDSIVYGSGIIQSKHLELLKHLNIKTIINLMEKSGSSLKESSEVSYHHFPVDDRTPPSDEVIEAILALLDPNPKGNNNNKVQTTGSLPRGAVVHCLGGKGRTAYVLLAYLMKYENIPLSEGFGILQAQRRETILSDSQKEALRQLEEKYVTVAGAAIGSEEEKEVEPDTTVTSASGEVDCSKHLNCDAIIMVGLPGSGKSSLAKHIQQHCCRVVRLSQDELGRKEAEKQLGKVKGSEIALIDRCNLTAAEREEWRPARAQRVLCIFVDLEPSVCIYRVKHRVGHETLRGTAAERVITELQAKLEIPQKESEGFCEVLRLTSESEVAYQVQQWGLPPLVPAPLDAPSIVKFPRTRHLINLGAATRDDLVLEQRDMEQFLNGPIVVEEKIDGANFGISIDPQTYEIVCQNRSHVVSAGYHPQFSKLQPWLQQHSAELYQLLEPGREVLYGEWLAAEHSIHYTNLPGYFIAFDLYDKYSNTFSSREYLEERMTLHTTIPLVHCIEPAGVYRTRKELEALVQTRSHYYDGKVEGVYLRRCEGYRTIDRAKIVRHDFITGNDHWTKKQMRLNVVKHQ